MAPEVVKNPLKDHPNDFKNEARYHYNSVVDSWAVGCLAYELIVGFPPFMADTQQQVVKNINTKEVAYPKKMSDEMISFCKAALERHPENRATTAELIKHPWIMLHMVSNAGVCHIVVPCRAVYAALYCVILQWEAADTATGSSALCSNAPCPLSVMCCTGYKWPCLHHYCADH